MDTIIILKSDQLGSGDASLGSRLMESYLSTMSTLEPRPDAMVFYNGAVRLLANMSPHLGPLRALEEAGVDLLACVTCLEFYHLLDEQALGRRSSMREIAALMVRARKVITP